MNTKLCICVYCLFCLGIAFAMHAMETNSAGNTAACPGAEHVEPFPLLQLPVYSIIDVTSFLDNDSFNAFTQSCRYLLLITNPFRLLPPCVRLKIMRMLSNSDIKSLWQVSKFCNASFIDPEKPLVIHCANYCPFFTKQSPAHAMIEHIGKLVGLADRRGMSASLDLSGQLERPYYKK